MPSVADYLFSEKNARVYAILDGASVEGLLDQLYALTPEFICLYRGELEPDLAEVAPYLIHLDPNSALTDWILERGWGRHWGVFALSRSDLKTMRQHLRRFLTVHDSEGSPLLFRYYDPRVLRVYLPTCNSEELATVFGPVLHYVVEGENPAELLRFQFAAGQLLTSSKMLGEVG